MSGYQLLPELSAEDYARLRADIAQRGVLVPVEVDENGTVLDGHHRQRIAAELGIDCPTVVRAGMAEHEKRLHAVALNLARRHLTDAQKVLLGRTIEPDVAERARERQGQRTDLVSTEVDTEPRGKLSTKSADKTRDAVAQQVGLGTGRTYAFQVGSSWIVWWPTELLRLAAAHPAAQWKSTVSPENDNPTRGWLLKGRLLRQLAAEDAA